MGVNKGQSLYDKGLYDLQDTYQDIVDTIATLIQEILE